MTEQSSDLNRLLEIVLGASDRGIGSPELEAAITDAVSRTHLSSQRANLLRPIQHLLTGRVLEAGAGCGALTRFLGELGAQVWALEANASQARICAARCEGLPNVSVVHSSLEEFDPPARFDVIVLGPGQPLDACGHLLSEDGVLIVAIENRLDLPFAGIKSGFHSREILYPFPDCKFPRVVLHASAFGEPDLDLAGLTGNALVEGPANSFLVVAFRKETGVPRAGSGNLAWIYSDSRRRCYATETVLSKASGQVLVRRSRLYPQAASPEDQFRVCMQDQPLNPGRAWINRLFPVVNRAGWTHDDIAAFARPWVEVLQRTGQALLPPEFWDCTPFNVFEHPDGSLVACDPELVAPHPVPLRFVVFRGLFLALAHLRSTDVPGPMPSNLLVELCGAVMGGLGIEVSLDDIEGFIEQEAAIQEELAGNGQAVLTNWRSATLPAARIDMASLSQRSRHAEALLRQTTTGLEAFQSRFDQALREYRSQRAWRVMLFFRKAYGQLFRQGWRGRLEFVRQMLAAPFQGIPELDRCELQFPNVLDYVPDAFDAPSPGGPQQPERGYDVIVLPVFEFDYRFQRPQQLAVQFASQGHRVFWISVSRRLPESSPKSYEAIQLRENLWEVSLRSPAPDVFKDRLEPGTAESILACLRDLYRDWGIGASCAMLQLPFWRRIGLGLKRALGAKIVFDCMDEWDAFPNVGDFNRGEQQELAREADLLVVTSQTLYQAYSQPGLQPLLVRNGVDCGFFSQSKPNDFLANLPKPVVGYFGAIADWFDFDLLREVARLRPRYSFVLIGAYGVEQQATGKSVALLKDEPNISLLGHQSYRNIPLYLSRFDACIIPFVINRVTRAADPIKLYEYFSQGKPVVATDLPELAQCEDLLYRAGDAQDFAAKLDLAVAEPDDNLKRRRMEFARANSWASRCAAIDSALRNHFEPVSILMVTYNSAPYIRPCLEALRHNTCYPNYEIIVVDNNSTDGSTDRLKEYAARDPRIQLICRSENAGFSAANNQAARQARGEYLVFLNADTVVTSGWVERLLRHCRRDSSVGMVVPVTNSAGNQARINVSYTDRQSMEQFALRLARANMDASIELEVGPLFCAMVPRRVWNGVGELDERFAVGMFEDDDFSLRLRQSGFRIVTAEDCFVHHFGQGSFSQLASERYNQVFEENRRRFEAKWNVTWKPHQYREGILPGVTHFAPSSFSKRDAADGAPTY